jgi:hypothetical protein
MHKSATKCNKTVGKWCINKHGASKIIDTSETYHTSAAGSVAGEGVEGSAAAALGGGIKELDVEVKEAAEGVMSDKS